MLNVTETGEFGASAAEVWTVVGDFVGLMEAIGYTVTGSGEGIGATRTVNGVVERLDRRDDETHSVTYVIVESGPLPVANYSSDITLDDVGPGRSRVTWTGDFDAVDVEDGKALRIISKTYLGGIAALQERFGA